MVSRISGDIVGWNPGSLFNNIHYLQYKAAQEARRKIIKTYSLMDYIKSFFGVDVFDKKFDEYYGIVRDKDKKEPKNIESNLK
jgi:hypothetical protein